MKIEKQNGPPLSEQLFDIKGISGLELALIHILVGRLNDGGSIYDHTYKIFPRLSSEGIIKSDPGLTYGGMEILRQRINKL